MIPWLSENNYVFPSIELALDEPNGLLAAGGDLSPGRLVTAYKKGIFPWYSEQDPILWWSPAPRCILPLKNLHISKSLAKLIRKQTFQITFDKDFQQVMGQCSQLRQHQEGTWITDEMQAAYYQLYLQGTAHSVEVWQDDALVGGLYGIAIGNIFFGESMFSKATNSSKVAFCYLVNQLKDWNFSIIDCQLHSNHLQSLGAIEVDRQTFQVYLDNINSTPVAIPSLHWSCDTQINPGSTV